MFEHTVVTAAAPLAELRADKDRFLPPEALKQSNPATRLCHPAASQYDNYCTHSLGIKEVYGGAKV